MLALPGEAVCVVGMIASLPANHRLRTIIGQDDFLQYSGRGSNSPCLVLGLPIHTLQGAGPPRTFYPLSDSLRATALLRARQRQQEQEQEERERNEELKRRREFWNSPLGQQELKNRMLEQLKSAGKLPVEIVDDPVIRRGLV
jgi:hypothetical protein